MRRAIFPGSFDPWHAGHEDILYKALEVFDVVVIARGINPAKKLSTTLKQLKYKLESEIHRECVKVIEYEGLLAHHIKEKGYDAIIKGLRNAADLEYETVQQYWNEDFDIQTPTFYIICDRNLRHISSSAIKAVEAIK